MNRDNLFKFGIKPNDILDYVRFKNDKPKDIFAVDYCKLEQEFKKLSKDEQRAFFISTNNNLVAYNNNSNKK